jgi:hypothetical protein
MSIQKMLKDIGYISNSYIEPATVYRLQAIQAEENEQKDNIKKALERLNKLSIEKLYCEGKQKQLSNQEIDISESEALISLGEKVKLYLPILMSQVQEISLQGKRQIQFEWTERNPISNGLSIEQFKVIMRDAEDFLRHLGYKPYAYLYSESWRRRSGKVGYGSIEW